MFPSKSWKLCNNYPSAHAITTYLQRNSCDRGKGRSISLWSLRCLYPDLSRLTGTTRCAVVKLEVTSTTVKPVIYWRALTTKPLENGDSQGFSFVYICSLFISNTFFLWSNKMVRKCILFSFFFKQIKPDTISWQYPLINYLWNVEILNQAGEYPTRKSPPRWDSERYVKTFWSCTWCSLGEFQSPTKFSKVL